MFPFAFLFVASGLQASELQASELQASEPAPYKRSASEPRPNLVLILADDVGHGDLACYGHPRIKTPRIDEFAGNALKFNSCYAPRKIVRPLELD
ncbi:MAG: hypothetical protein ACI9HK_004493 [Pirellulaceae bacterium]|jgi:hypothetical protein